MTADRYIVIPNWDRFQHYKDRTPLWIKTYTELLSDPAYVELTGPQRATLHGLWLLYAKGRRNIPENTGYVSRQLGLRVTKRTLEALNHAGFIEISASGALAEPYQPASPEKSREENKSLETNPEVRNVSEGSTYVKASHYVADQINDNGLSHALAHPDLFKPGVLPEKETR